MTGATPICIRSNVEFVLEQLGIQGLEWTDTTRPDRVFGFDRNRQLLVHYMRYSGPGQHWHLDGRGPELAHFHGKSALYSFRENAPNCSMQVVFHAISDASPSREDSYFVELDVDHQAPTNPVKLLVHGEEVLVNAITGSTTDQIDIAHRLALRFGPGSIPA